jgi:phospholipase C
MSHADPAASSTPETTTPIEHLVVIFQENVSFDHYFATYPVALNPPGEPRFHARDDTPSARAGPRLRVPADLTGGARGRLPLIWW